MKQRSIDNKPTENIKWNKTYSIQKKVEKKKRGEKRDETNREQVVRQKI